MNKFAFFKRPECVIIATAFAVAAALAIYEAIANGQAEWLDPTPLMKF